MQLPRTAALNPIGNLYRVTVVVYPDPAPENRQALRTHLDLVFDFHRYDVTHLERLIFIRRCRALEMTQHEIHELLQARAEPNASCVSINELLDGHIEHVRHRIVELEALQQQLVELRQQCHEVHTNQDCGILRELDSVESMLMVGKKLHKIC